MAEGDLITKDFQMEYDGIVLGNPTQWIIEEINGLHMPNMRGSDYERPQDHGQYPGETWFAGRDIEVQFSLIEDDRASAVAALRELASVISPMTHDEKPLVIQLPDIGKVRTNARVYRASFPLNWQVQRGYVRPLVQWHATDPRLYSNVESSAVATGGSSVGGLDLPHEFPHGFGFVEPGSLTAENEGNFGTYPVATVTVTSGNISHLHLRNLTTDELFAMTINLSAGDTMIIDFGARTAMLGGTASRAANVDRPDSVWFDLEPGTNVLEFGYSTGGDVGVELVWRSAWII